MSKQESIGLQSPNMYYLRISNNKFEQMKKNRGPDNTLDLNYKQLTKIKYLKKQCERTQQLRQKLALCNEKAQKQLTTASKIHKNSTSIQIEQTGSSLKKILNFMKGIRDGLISSKESAEVVIFQQECQKKEQEFLFEKILLGYDEEILMMREEIVVKENYIKTIEKNKRLQKNIVLHPKVLLLIMKNIPALYSNINIFEQFTKQSQNLTKLTKDSIKLKNQINQDIDEIRRIQNTLLKLKMAKDTEMPYYRFRQIIKNGIDHFSDCDNQQYKIVLDQSPKKKQKTSTKSYLCQWPSKETLDLILKQQELNNKYYRAKIQQQIKKQQEYQRNIELLIEALNIKQHKRMCDQIIVKLKNQQTEQSKTKWQSISTIAHPQQNNSHQNNQCNGMDYRILWEDMAAQINEKINEKFTFRKIYLKRSKSQVIKTTKAWSEQEDTPTHLFVKEWEHKLTDIGTQMIQIK